jgi:hypothetical protein
MADNVAVPVIAGLASGIAFLLIFALVLAPYGFRLSASDVTCNNPYGVRARVAYAHTFSGLSCPSLPCDTSGFVLQMLSDRDVMILGYEASDVASTCVYSDGMQTYLPCMSKATDGNYVASFLGKKSNWHVGDPIVIKVKMAPAVGKLENDIMA